MVLGQLEWGGGKRRKGVGPRERKWFSNSYMLNLERNFEKGFSQEFKGDSNEI
jgi:hypothetical protein